VHVEMHPMTLSLVIGGGLGLLLVVAPPLAGDIAVTDPVLLGSVWFVRPQSLLIIVPPLLFLTIGAGIGVLGRFKTSVNTTAVVLVATAVNAAATLLENAYDAGVMGVGWWLIGSIVSAAFMLLGGAVVRGVTSSSGSRVAGDR
jgi:hypothetical protein